MVDNSRALIAAMQETYNTLLWLLNGTLIASVIGMLLVVIFDRYERWRYAVLLSIVALLVVLGSEYWIIFYGRYGE